MDIIALLITFVAIGGISRAGILFIQWLKGQTADELIKLSERSELRQISQRLNIALQVIWVFIATLIMVEFENSMLSVHALIIVASASSPVIVYSGMRWIRGNDGWSAWAFIVGLFLVFIAGTPLNDYMHDDQLFGAAGSMFVAFCLFNLIGSCQMLLAYIGGRKSTKP